MKTGYKIEINVKQASTLTEVLAQVKGAHDALKALVNAGAKLKDLKIGDYGSNVQAQIYSDPVYEPGDVKYYYGKSSYLIGEQGEEHPISPVEYVARRLAKVVKAYSEAGTILDGTYEIIKKAYSDLDIPSEIDSVVSTENVDHEDAAVRIIGSETTETWLVTGKGEAIREVTPGM